MNENKIRELFENGIHDFKTELQKDIPFYGNRKIDYTVKEGGLVIGIEVKGSRSNIYNTIGELFLMKQVFSHIYLLAPVNFIKKLTSVVGHTLLLAEIGLLAPDKNRIVVLKKPDVEEYYFKPLVKERKQPRSLKNHLLINENDIEILKKFKDRVFTAVDISKEFNCTRTNAYRRIARLKKSGTIEQVVGVGNPKAYRIIKYVDTPAVTQNTT